MMLSFFVQAYWHLHFFFLEKCSHLCPSLNWVVYFCFLLLRLGINPLTDTWFANVFILLIVFFLMQKHFKCSWTLCIIPFCVVRTSTQKNIFRKEDLFWLTALEVHSLTLDSPIILMSEEEGEWWNAYKGRFRCWARKRRGKGCPGLSVFMWSLVIKPWLWDRCSTTVTSPSAHLWMSCLGKFQLLIHQPMTLEFIMPSSSNRCVYVLLFCTCGVMTKEQQSNAISSNFYLVLSSKTFRIFSLTFGLLIYFMSLFVEGN